MRIWICRKKPEFATKTRSIKTTLRSFKKAMRTKEKERDATSLVRAEKRHTLPPTPFSQKSHPAQLDAVS